MLWAGLGTTSLGPQEDPAQAWLLHSLLSSPWDLPQPFPGGPGAADSAGRDGLARRQGPHPGLRFPLRKTEGPHLGLTHEPRHREEMLTHTTHATPPPIHTGTRAEPHLPGCGRTPRGSLPSAHGPARSHACRSPASGPPAIHWERMRGSLGLLPTSTSSPPHRPQTLVPVPPHQASGIPACQGPQGSCPQMCFCVRGRMCMCVSMCGCVSGYTSVCFPVYVSM